MATILHEKGGKHDTAVEFIPYPKLAANLFSTDQKLVPFLGAGASLFAQPTSGETVHPLNASDDKINELCNSFGLKDDVARILVAAAINVGLRLQADRVAETARTNAAKAPRTMAPSASELASELSTSLEYDYFEEPARRLGQALAWEMGQLADMLRRATLTTGVAATAPPLIGIASYYQYREGPTSLREVLYNRFKDVTEITRAHRLVACTARYYLERNPQEPYLCVTTNYDRLLELAMTGADVPHCVVTVPKSGTSVRTTFSMSVRDHLGLDDEGFRRLVRDQNLMTPEGYYLIPRRPLAVIYKMHGSLDLEEQQDDSVVISEEDYIENIRLSGPNSRLIPNQFRTLMGYRNFMFLGYSFSDWNVRLFYKLLQTIRADQRFESKDYAVVNRADPYESVFFRKKDINVCLTTLDRFTQGIAQHAPQAKCLEGV